MCHFQQFLSFSIAYNCGASKPSSLTSPSGNANTTWIQFISTYTATKTNPVLIFGIDGATSIFVLLDDVSVVDTSNPSVELLNNPSFENSLSSAIGWTAWCASSCSNGTAGNVTINGCRSGICYTGSCNGGGVDYLAQRFPAIFGRAYNISFWYQRVRTASGSASVTLYAGIIWSILRRTLAAAMDQHQSLSHRQVCFRLYSSNHIYYDVLSNKIEQNNTHSYLSLNMKIVRHIDERCLDMK